MLIQNEILGFVTEQEFNKAIEVKAIVKQYGKWRLNPIPYENWKEWQKNLNNAQRYNKEANESLEYDMSKIKEIL